MLKNLFKPKWQHPKPQIRAEGIKQLDLNTPDHVQLLHELMTNDESAEVRLAAVRRCQDPALCINIIEQDQDANVREVAISRLRSLLALQTTPTLPEEVSAAHLAHIDHIDVLRFVAKECASEGLRKIAINSLSDQATLAEIAISDNVTRLRQLAADRIHASDALTLVYKACKGRDSKVARIVKEKIDAIRADEEQSQQHLEQLEQLFDRLAHLANTDFVGRHQQAQLVAAKWAQLDGPLQTHLHEKFQQLLESIPQETAPPTDTTPSVDEHQLHDQFADHIQQWQQGKVTQDLLDQTTSALHEAHGVELTGILANQKAYLSQWVKAGQQLLERLDHIEALKKNTIDLDHRGAINQRIKAIEKITNNIRWPETLNTPSTLEWLTSETHTLKQRLSDLSKLEKQRIKETEELLTQLENSIDEGHVKKARNQRKNVERLLHQIDEKHSQALQQKYVRLNQALQELYDWQGYAVMPKQQELLEHMRALIDDTGDLDTRAKKIKKLQEDWKTLRSNHPDSHALWEAFQKASDDAYEPCKNYYQAKAQIRQTNLEKRQTLCTELETFSEKTPWNSLDLATLEQIKAKAWEEWKNYTPVNRKAGEPVFERFQAALTPLNQAIKQAIEHGVKQRQKLIDQVQQACESQSKDAANIAKTAQAQWKACDHIPRAVEQKLWKALRRHCDKIFNQRQAEHQAKKTAMDQVAQTLTQLLDDFEQHIQSAHNETDLRQAQKRTQEQWQAQETIPAEKAKHLNKRFDQLKHLAQNRLQQYAMANQIATFEQLVNESKQCAQLEIAAANAQWQTPDETPPSSHLADRWQTICAAHKQQQQIRWNPDDQQTHLHLLIDLEILGNIPTPKEEQALRLERQVARLNDSMGVPDTSPPIQQALELAHRCLNIPAFDPTVREAYEARLQRAIKTIATQQEGKQ